MPYTPFHFPASAAVGWPLRRHLDLPTFLLVNLAVDVEPLIVTLLDLGPPPHGYAHTLLGATVVGAVAGWLFWRAKGLLESMFVEDYPLTVRVAVTSGVAGAWFHVLLDAVMYAHLRPFWPVTANPLHVEGSGDPLHVACAVLLVPVLALLLHRRYWRTLPQKLTLGLVLASGLGMAGSVAAGVV